MCVCVERKKTTHTAVLLQDDRWIITTIIPRDIRIKRASFRQVRRERNFFYYFSVRFCRSFHQPFCVLLFITSFLGPPFSDLFGIERDKEGCLLYVLLLSLIRFVFLFVYRISVCVKCAGNPRIVIVLLAN